MGIKDYRDLEIWKRGMDLVEVIYSLTLSMPKEEVYGLTAHLRKTAVSIPSNIAEGFARSYAKEFRQFLFVSLGSCAELNTQILIAMRLKFLDPEKVESLSREIDVTSKMIMALIKKVNQRQETSD
jgi:four helix bundle protein